MAESKSNEQVLDAILRRFEKRDRDSASRLLKIRAELTNFEDSLRKEAETSEMERNVTNTLYRKLQRIVLTFKEENSKLVHKNEALLEENALLQNELKQTNEQFTLLEKAVEDTQVRLQTIRRSSNKRPQRAQNQEIVLEKPRQQREDKPTLYSNTASSDFGVNDANKQPQTPRNDKKIENTSMPTTPAKSTTNTVMHNETDLGRKRTAVVLNFPSIKRARTDQYPSEGSAM